MQFSKYKPLGRLFLQGRFNGGFFVLPVWGAYFWRGLYSEGLIYGGKFAFQNRLGQLVKERKFTIFALFFFVFEGKFQVQAPPPGDYIRRGDLTEGFLR